MTAAAAAAGAPLVRSSRLMLKRRRGQLKSYALDDDDDDDAVLGEMISEEEAEEEAEEEEEEEGDDLSEEEDEDEEEEEREGDSEEEASEGEEEDSEEEGERPSRRSGFIPPRSKRAVKGRASGLRVSPGAGQRGSGQPPKKRAAVAGMKALPGKASSIRSGGKGITLAAAAAVAEKKGVGLFGRIARQIRLTWKVAEGLEQDEEWDAC